MKKVLIVVAVVLLGIPFVLASALGIMYLYADNKPDIRNGYNEKIETGGVIEAKYLQFGEYETNKFTAKEEKPIEKYTVYYPKALENNNDVTYPMILIVNGTGGKATKYEPQFKLFASWGFIVVGTQDKCTGTGETTIKTLKYMLGQNENSNSIFFNKIDTDNIGITGFSQGGAAVFNAITKYDEASSFKTAVPISPVCEKTAEATMDYPYDSSEVKCPILLLAGTSGEFETEIVIPFEEMVKQYEKISAPKVMARRIGMTHDDMMYSAGGYVLAWFKWQLQSDTEAATVFIGNDAEILNNSCWQDVNKSF